MVVAVAGFAGREDACLVLSCPVQLRWGSWRVVIGGMGVVISLWD